MLNGWTYFLSEAGDLTIQEAFRAPSTHAVVGVKLRQCLSSSSFDDETSTSIIYFPPLNDDVRNKTNQVSRLTSLVRLAYTGIR